jgi:hypothetical protein
MSLGVKLRTSLKFKLAAITSATIIAVGLGVAIAAPASAVDNQFLCYVSSAGRYYYVNEDTGLCLNDQYYDFLVNAATCNEGTDELWYGESE